MKKALPTIAVFLCAVLCCNISRSQIISKNYLVPAAVQDIKSRTLLVELLKEDPAYVEKLKDKAEDLSNYKKWIVNYNKMIQKYVRDYWKISADIEYKYAEEIRAIPVADTKKYAVLLYTELEDNTTDVFNHTGLMVPALLFHRAEMPYKKPDVKFPVPSSYARESDNLERTDFIVALMLLQNEVEYIMNEKGDVKTSYMNYIKSEAKKNCELLEKKTLLLEPVLAMKDLKVENIKKYCSLTVNLSAAEENNDVIYNLTDGFAIVTTIPVNYVKATSATAPYVFKRESVAYAKVLVDTRNFKILNMVWPNLSSSYDYTIKEILFKKVCTCPE